MSERVVLDICERALTEEGFRPDLNIRVPDLNLYPDLLCLVPPLTLIIEVDENQHKNQRGGDKIRSTRLAEKFSPLLLLRINPDAYGDWAGLVDVKTNLKGVGVEREIKLNKGEVERRGGIIRRVLLALVMETLTDTRLGVKLKPFRELYLFFN